MQDVATPSQPYIIAAVIALATVIGYLFKLLINKLERGNDEKLVLIAGRDAERTEWAKEREGIRADFEEKLREVAEEYALNMKAIHDDARKHEDEVRREFADLMDQVTAKAGEQSQSIVAVLDKFYDRFVGPRPRY